MPKDGYEVPLSLTTICGGNLEREFQRVYPEAVAKLKEGEKATITITLEFKRVKDTKTMVGTSYKLATKTPPQANTSICQIVDEGADKFTLLTEKPEPEKVVSLFKEA